RGSSSGEARPMARPSGGITARARSYAAEIRDVLGPRGPVRVARPFLGTAGHFLAVAHAEQEGALRAVDVFVQFAPREARRFDLDGFGRGAHSAPALEAKVDLGRVGVAVIGARLTRLPTGDCD